MLYILEVYYFDVLAEEILYLGAASCAGCCNILFNTARQGFPLNHWNVKSYWLLCLHSY